MSQYNDKDGNIFLIPNFVQLYNYKNKKREIFINKDYIEYILSFDSPTIEIILDRLTEAEINITDLQNDKLDISEAYNTFYQKINLANATKYVLSQTNNVLSLWNLNLDFYDKTEIDDFLDNVSALLDLKLTQPVNMTAGQQIIAINPDQSVQLVNATGLNYILEDTINKTLTFNVTDSTGIIDNQINSVSKLKITNNAINPSVILDFLGIQPQIFYNGNRKFYVSGSDTFFWNSSLRLCTLVNANTETNYYFQISQTVMNIYGQYFNWLSNQIDLRFNNVQKFRADANNTIINNVQALSLQVNGNTKAFFQPNTSILNNVTSIDLQVNDVSKIFTNSSQTSIQNDEINLSTNSNVIIKTSQNEIQLWNQIQSGSLTYKNFFLGNKYSVSGDPGVNFLQIFSFVYETYNTSLAAAVQRNFFQMIYQNRESVQQIPEIICNAKIRMEGADININAPNALRCRDFYKADNIGNDPLNFYAPIYLAPGYYFQQTNLGTNSSYWQQQPNSIQYYNKVSSGSYINGNTYVNSSSDWYRWILRLSSQGGLLCHSQLIMSSSIHIKNIIKTEKEMFEKFKIDDFFNYDICTYKYKQNSGEYQNNKEDEIFGVYMEQFKQDKKHDQFLKKSQYQLYLIEERKEKQSKKQKEINKKDLYYYFDFCLDKFAQYQTQFAFSQEDEVIDVLDIDYEKGNVLLQKEIDFSKDLILLINSYGFDTEKVIQYILVQNKFLFEKNKDLEAKQAELAKKIDKLEQTVNELKAEFQTLIQKMNL